MLEHEIAEEMEYYVAKDIDTDTDYKNTPHIVSQTHRVQQTKIMNRQRKLLLMTRCLLT